MATDAAAADGEHIEAMEQVEGEERAAGAAAAAAADDDGVPTEAMEQVGGDEAEADASVDDEAAEAMEQVGGDEAEAADAAADDEAAEAMEQVGGDEAAADAAADDEAAEAMEQDEGEERAEVEAEEEEEEEGDASAEAHMEASDQIEEEEVHAVAEAEEDAEVRPLQTVLPLGRVKKIMRVDRDIRKVTAEASLLIAAATELFVGSLATGAHTAASQGGRRAVRAAHVRAAVRAHRPTADFLLDCLPAAEAAPRAARSGSDGAAVVKEAAPPKPLPRGTRRIDGFFLKVT